jgi:hypothetical protein
MSEQRILEICAKAHPLKPGGKSLRVQADNPSGSMVISLAAYFLFLRNSRVT